MLGGGLLLPVIFGVTEPVKISYCTFGHQPILMIQMPKRAVDTRTHMHVYTVYPFLLAHRCACS